MYVDGKKGLKGYVNKGISAALGLTAGKKKGTEQLRHPSQNLEIFLELKTWIHKPPTKSFAAVNSCNIIINNFPY